VPRLLIVSDSPAVSSGMGRVVRELAPRFLADGFDVACAGWFDLEAPAREFDYPVFPIQKHEPASVGPYLEHFAPDLVLAIGDPWDWAWLVNHRLTVGGYKLLAYLNVEGEPLPLPCERILDGFDAVCTSSQYGARVVGRPGVTAIHYGVDTEMFAPMPKLSKVMFGKQLDTTFIVLINGQNTFRKNLGAAMAGFLQFARGKDDVLAYFNTVARPGPNDAPGVDLIELSIQLEAEKLCWFNPENHGPIKTIDDTALNGLYGIASVLLLTSVGEGFGLPVLEAMAAGVVPVVPNAFSMPELLRTEPGNYARGFGVPVHAYISTLQGQRVPVVADEDIAIALQAAYDAWHRRPIVGDSGGEGRFAIMRAQGLDFAKEKTWDRTYTQLSTVCLETLRLPRLRLAIGRPIEASIRLFARRAAHRHPEAFGVLKLGGLGDMLQATAVIRAAAVKSGRKAVVFCNAHADVFLAMPEVLDVVPLAPMPQQMAVDSLADEFPLFLDLRYVSRAYGLWKPTEFADKHRWFYDFWTPSSSRLETLGMHSTQVMLDSLGLDGPIWPVYESRTKPIPAPERPYVTLATGVGAMGGLKRWPAENWAKLARELQMDGIRLAQVGGVGDDAVDGVDYDYRGAGLRETAWLLAESRLLIAVEGGIVHLAAAVMGPSRVVGVIFGPTPPVAFLYPGHVALKGPDLCSPCWQVEPNWKHAQCSIAQPSCVNFPSVTEVMIALRSAEAEVAAHMSIFAHPARHSSSAVSAHG
jgi:glycosyltransferase involved in cell wall biosynthesis